MHEATKNLQDKIKELANTYYKAVTQLSKCKSCGICVLYCPLKIRAFNNEGKAITIKTHKTCGGCSVCYHRCPENAIFLLPLQKEL